MNRMSSGIAAILAFTLVEANCSSVCAEETAQESSSAKVVEFMMSQVAAYDATIGTNKRRMPLHTTPVLKWTNPVSGIDHGLLVMWLDQNRPVVAAQVFKIPKPVLWLHECQSLASEPIRMELGGKPFWAPTRGMLEFKELPGEPPAPEKAALALTQARSIARRFEATEDFRNTPGDDATRFVLRLVGQPVYQYESTHHNVTNGFVFAFVNGTDPEVLLVLEAFSRDAKRGWRYLLSPMTCWGVGAKLDGKEVWTLEEQYGKTTARDPYFTWAVDASLIQKDPTN